MNQALQIRSALASEQLPVPCQAWFQTLITQQPPQQRTLPALVAAAKARLLASDLTASGLFDTTSPPPVFPREVVSSSPASVQETCLAHDVVAQVVDLENVSQSRWQQVQALEAIERGEQKRGREIIRVLAGGDAGNDGEAGDETDTGNGNADGRPVARASATGGTSDANATHRLVLQDAAGQTLFALELTRIYRIGIGRLRIGEKLLLKKGTVVARGTLLLEPASVRFLGGQVEPLNKAWVEGRLARLRSEAQAAGQRE
ncbi:hypothetical protein SBRCBS47491_004791 [Sporothrix bragantina]|uniref:RecQ-mediated genome instability protein 1 n=1 Tax=Sporothrix bragantina TaxID=671064 RepID=A0ABP0BRC2_9PEZI